MAVSKIDEGRRPRRTLFRGKKKKEKPKMLIISRSFITGTILFCKSKTKECFLYIIFTLYIHTYKLP
jgi:hypothetical protein